jgi:hypothetical protein
MLLMEVKNLKTAKLGLLSKKTLGVISEHISTNTNQLSKGNWQTWSRKVADTNMTRSSRLISQVLRVLTLGVLDTVNFKIISK